MAKATARHERTLRRRPSCRSVAAGEGDQRTDHHAGADANDGSESGLSWRAPYRRSYPEFAPRHGLHHLEGRIAELDHLASGRWASADPTWAHRLPARDRCCRPGLTACYPRSAVASQRYGRFVIIVEGRSWCGVVDGLSEAGGATAVAHQRRSTAVDLMRTFGRVRSCRSRGSAATPRSALGMLGSHATVWPGGLRRRWRWWPHAAARPLSVQRTLRRR